jgi:hypothetical protein
LPPSNATNFCAATKKNSFAGETEFAEREVPRLPVRYAAKFWGEKNPPAFCRTLKRFSPASYLQGLKEFF